MPTHGSVINLIDSFLKEASASEDGMSKEATNLDLAGDAKSTHPSANVDDKTKPAAEGSRSSENEADVKKDVPNTINNPDTENTDAKGNEGATVNGDQGTTTMAADSGLKGNVDTPKKDHSQSMADSGPGDGSESFSGDWDKASAAEQLVGEANSLLADVAMLSKGAAMSKKKAAQPKIEVEVETEDEDEDEDEGEEQKSAAASGQAAGDEAAALFKQAAEQYPEDVEAGYVAAALLAQQMGLMKEASEEPTVEAATVEGIQKMASVDADNYATFLQGYADLMQKVAMGAEMEPEALAALAGEGEAGGEPGIEEMAAGAEDEGAGEALEEAGEAEEEEGEGEAGDEEVMAIAKLLADAGIPLEQVTGVLENAEEGDEGEGAEAAPEVA